MSLGGKDERLKERQSLLQMVRQHFFGSFEIFGVGLG